MKAEELEFGKEYKMDSNLGGVFSITYMGDDGGQLGNDGEKRHIFIVSNPGWERTHTWTDEQVSRLVLEN